MEPVSGIDLLAVLFATLCLYSAYTLTKAS
jgi:hypothetical protein